MARRRTGQLTWRASGWHARVTTVVEGEKIRVMRALGTTNEAVAKRRLARLLEAENPKTVDAQRPETFAEAADRFYKARIAEAADARGPREELASLERYAFGVIGKMPTPDVQPADINTVLDAVKDAGKSRQTAQHVRQRLSNVFAQLCREGACKANPVAGASMPRFPKEMIRERAVLTDAELAVYLSWEHPEDRHQGAVRERQTMACMSRMFGGLRTGDLHALRWEAFETEGGRFSCGYAPRQKTRRPQLLEVPEPLRPFLRDWWERAGRPTEGLLFPVRRIGKLGDRVGDARLGVSHAAAFRRDLKSAFRWAAEHNIAGAPKEDSQRWRELFTVTEYTLKVDFHSWRRAFAQALADADVSAQQATALAGHGSLSAHMRYLRSAGKMRRLPEGALPVLSVVEAPNDKAIAKGTAPVLAAFEAPRALPEHAETSGIVSYAAQVDSLLSRRSQVRVLPGALRIPRV